MPAPVVVVDVAPMPDAQLATALVTACCDAMRSGRCELAHAGPPPKEAWAIAVITWQSADEAQVRFETAAPHPSTTRFRSLVFRPEDDLSERWRTVGFAVAMLADTVAASELAPEPPFADEPKKEASPSPTSRPPRRPHVFRETPVVRVAVAVGAGPALDDGSIRFGGGLHGALQPWTLPVFGSVTVRYTIRPEDERGVVVHWATFSGGVGGLLTPSSLDAEVSARLEARARFLSVHVTDPESGLTDGAERWSLGPLLAIDAAWPVRTLVAALLSTEGSCSSRPTSIDVRRRSIGTVPVCDWVALAGIEVRFR